MVHPLFQQLNQIKIDFYFGNQKIFDKPVTTQEVAEAIGPGLAKAALAGKVNDKLIDICIPIDKDSTLSIITSKDIEGLGRKRKGEDQENLNH